MRSFKAPAFVALFVIISFLAACGSGSSSEGGTADGRVSLLITDGITTDFDQINLTVDSIRFLGGNGAGDVTVFYEPKVINLLALQNYSDVLVTTSLPAGSYNKIRLQLSQIELVRLNPDGTILSSDIAKLPANGKLDLNPRSPFVVTGNGHLLIELDLDAEKSIHIVDKGNGKRDYNFRPVVFINVLGEEQIKLVLLEGKVFEKTDNDFALCDVQDVALNDNCYSVLITQDTVVQDAAIAAGAPGDITDEDVVTVLGRAGTEAVDALHIVIASSDLLNRNLGLFNGQAASNMDVLVPGFDMVVAEINGVAAGVGSLPVTLDDSARVFDKHGLQVNADVIIAGTDVDVFGLAQPGLTSVSGVRAAFVIYDDPVSNLTISGPVIDILNNVITVNTGDNITTVTECADVTNAETIYLSIVNGNLEHNEINVNDLPLGVTVTVYGTNDGAACMTANVVVAIDDSVLTP